MQPPCDKFVPGYGDANAHLHVIGDHPGVHGGADSGVPFTNCPAGNRLQHALVAAGLLDRAGTPPTVNQTFLSYLHACVPGDGNPPTADEYARLEPMFDAELRAITAHVLLPVGERATRHVLENYTARRPTRDVESLHATEVRGSGFLVYPITEPTNWTTADEQDLVSALQQLQQSDYRREVDLGRFIADENPYFVR